MTRLLAKHLLAPIIDEVVGFITTRLFAPFEQQYIRERQEQIRAIVKQKHTIQQNVLETLGDISETRKHLRYVRRGAIISYRKAQRDLLSVALTSLEDAKSVSYRRLKTVQDRVNDKQGMGRSYIDPNLFTEFQNLKNAVHAEIADSKWLTTWLKERLIYVKCELRTLNDPKTHNKFGGKKDVLNLLAELQRDGRNRLARKEAKESILTVASFSYVLESQCRTCRAWLSSAMGFCPLCGSSQGEERPRRFLKKDAILGASCHHCRAPAADEFTYCFNCGERNDPCGLWSAANARLHR